jgi:hypothetical protein
MTTTAHIQDRYCKRWLKIKNTPEVVGQYDTDLVTRETSMSALQKESGKAAITEVFDSLIDGRYNSNDTAIEYPYQYQCDSQAPLPVLHSSIARSAGYAVPIEAPDALRSNLALPIHTEGLQSTTEACSPSQSGRKPSVPVPDLRQEVGNHTVNQTNFRTIRKPALYSFYPQDSVPSSNSRSSSAMSHSSRKRLRPNRPDSIDSIAAAQIGVTGSNLQKMQRKLRDSGFFSLSSFSSKSDVNSFISRFSRLSVDFKTCKMDHKALGLGESCSLCGYPRKPLVHVATEFLESQDANIVDADNMDNGIMTMNADA